ncbi:hypothetical protein AA313_de0204436 [Arthrobotrys entomopaga]|nr:hypothetical protein AA313_de0204436 [Arthrobotrys entomopaga]
MLHLLSRVGNRLIRSFVSASICCCSEGRVEEIGIVLSLFCFSRVLFATKGVVLCELAGGEAILGRACRAAGKRLTAAAGSSGNSRWFLAHSEMQIRACRCCKMPVKDLVGGFENKMVKNQIQRIFLAIVLRTRTGNSSSSSSIR